MDQDYDSNFICNACQCALPSAELRATHYRSDWHRYNVRRRCADLPPIPKDLFMRKYDTVREELAASPETEHVCPITKKTFKSAAALEHFHSSKAYKKALEKASQRGDRAAAVAERAARGEAVPVEVRNAEGVVVDKVLYRAPTADEDVENPHEAAMLARDEARRVAAAAATTAVPAAPTAEPAAPVLTPAAVNVTAAESAAAALAAEEALRTGQLPAPTSSSVVALLREAGAAEDDLSRRPVPLRYSLFDRVGPFKSVKGSLDYMLKKFGFHLPFVEYLTDLEGLLQFLGAKIGVGHVCLWCQKPFNSLKDVQQHMRDKGHCMISLDDETGNEDEDLLEFYEFTHNIDDEAAEDPSDADDDEDAAEEAAGDAPALISTMRDDDDEEEEAQQPTAAPAAKKAPSGRRLTKDERLQLRAGQRLRTLQLLQQRGGADAEADEAQLESLASIPVAERALIERPEVMYKGLLTFAAPRRKGIVERNELGELVLSDGSVIGHRDYKRMYKQRSVTTKERDASVEQEAGHLRRALTNEYYAMQIPGYAMTTRAYAAATATQHRDAYQRKLRESNRAGISYNMILRRWFRHANPK